MSRLVDCSNLTSLTEVGTVPKLWVMSLTPTQQPIHSEILSNPNVYAVSLRQNWRAIERTQGQYDWTYLDAEIARAVAAGKRVMLRLVMGGTNVPDWLFAAGVATYTTIDPQPYRQTYGQPVEVAIWWDALYLAQARALLEVAGQRYADRVDILAVPLANTFTAEWNVYVNTDDGDDVELLQAGYSDDVLVTACHALLTAASIAFPTSRLTVAIGPTARQLTGSDRYRPVKLLWDRASSLHPRLYYQANDLSMFTPNLSAPDARWTILIERRPYLAAQMLWYVYGDQTYRMNDGVAYSPAFEILKTAISNGVAAGTRWQEIYEEDIRQYRQVIQWAANRVVAA